jgi:hypothetical protein
MRGIFPNVEQAEVFNRNHDGLAQAASLRES